MAENEDTPEIDSLKGADQERLVVVSSEPTLDNVEGDAQSKMQEHTDPVKRANDEERVVVVDNELARLSDDGQQTMQEHTDPLKGAGQEERLAVVDCETVLENVAGDGQPMMQEYTDDRQEVQISLDDMVFVEVGDAAENGAIDDQTTKQGIQGKLSNL
jgi:hypothetical protein